MPSQFVRPTPAKPAPGPEERVRKALRDIEVADSAFNYASGLLEIDTAILCRFYAQKRLASALRECRSLFCLDPLDKVSDRGKGCQR